MPSYQGDQLILTPLATPAAPTLQVHGTPGESTYSYQVVAKKGALSTDASPVATTTTGPSSLTVLRAIYITPPYVAGAQTFDVYRVSGGSSQGKIGTVVVSNQGTVQRALLVDHGQTATMGDPPTENVTGQLRLGQTADSPGNLLVLEAVENDADDSEAALVIHDARGAAEVSLLVASTYTSQDEWEGLRVNASTNTVQLLAESDGDQGSMGMGVYAGSNGIGLHTSGTLLMAALAYAMPNLPTSDPHVAHQLWNDSGTLKVSAG